MHFYPAKQHVHIMYLALLGASKLQKPGTRQKVRDKAHFDPEALNNLVQTLHSSKHHEQTRWFNAFLGRVFLSIYKTQKVKDYFIQKITRKSMKLKRPSFLGQIKVRSFDVGNSIPFITRTRLHDLDPSGELTAEFHLDYKGGVRVEIEVDVGIGLTSIKPVKVTVVLAVLMKAISGMMTLRIKAPPTNRFWLGFQEPPKMDIVIEPIVADKAIKLQMVLNAIETKIREAIIENIVLPNMDDNPFFDSHGRGGVFEGDEIIGGPPSSSSSSALAQEDRGEQAGGDLDHGGEDYEDDEDDESEEEDEDDHLSEDEDEHASIIFNSDPFSIDRMSKEGVGIAGGIAPGMVRQHSSRSNGGFDGKSASIISAPGVLSSEGTPSLMFKRRSYHAGMAGGHHGIDPDHDSESSRSGSTRGEHHQVGQQHLGVNNSSTNGTSGTATGSGSGTTTSKWMAKIKQLSGNHFNRSAESLSDTSSSKLNTKPTVATSTATAVRTTASDLQHKAVRKASKLNESIPKLAASVHLPEAGEVLHEKMARVLGTNHKSQSGSSSTSNSTNNNNPNSSGNVVMGGSVSKDGKQQQQQQQPLSSSPLSASPLHGPVKKLSTASLKRLSTLESPTTVADEDSPGAADSPGTDYTNTISSVQHPVSSAAANASGGENGSESPGLPLESRSSSSTSYSSNVGSSSMRSGFDTFPRATLTRNRQSLPASAVVAATTVAATQATTTPTITPALHGSSSFVGIAGILDGDSERAKNSKVHNTDPQIQQQQQQQQHPTISTSTSTGSLRSAASHLEHVLTRSDEAAEAIRNEAEAAKGSRAPSPSPLSPSWPSAATPTLAEPVVTAVPIISASRSSSDLFSESGGSSGGGGGRRASVDTTSAKNMPLEGGGDDSDMAAQSSTLQRRRSKTAKEGKTEGGKRTSVGGKTHQRQGSLPFLGGRASHPLQTTQTDNGRSATRTSLSEEDRKKAEDRIRESAMLPPTPPGGPSLSRTSSMGDLSLSSFTTSAWRSDQRGGENAVERPDGERRLSFRRGSLTSPPSSLLSTLTTDSEGRSSTRSSSSARTMISNFFKDSSALKTQAATAFSETKARVKRRIEERRMSEDDPLLSGRMRPGD
ncbi:hypothetical protein BGZ73_002752 [Actinomortierella ambigua]|nr:hypothetical protein BGZ73_002752 [Actinomortierella ambigua]